MPGHTVPVLGLVLVALTAVTPTASAAPTGANVRSVTVQLASDAHAVKALAHARGLPPQARLHRLRHLVPAAATRSRVEGILATEGLRVTHETAFSVTAAGPSSRVEAAFPRHVTRRGSTGSLVPGALAGLVTSVVDDTTLAGVLRPALTPTQIDGASARQIYDTTAGAPPAGERSPAIATLQFSGWNDGDLSTFAGHAGLPDPVASGQYTAVSVDGADPWQADGFGGQGEVALDQETLLDTAPHAPQRAYFAPNSAQGEVDALEQVASDAMSAGDIAALSISWGACEADYSGAIAPIDRALTDVLAAGVTVFASSGDSGAFDCSTPSTPDASLAVDFPASDPLVVGVGGTTVDDNVPTSPQEQVWWDGVNGGGGGVSDFFAEPGYQNSAGLNGRGVPDVALDADPSSGAAVYVDGRWETDGGTSLASPLAAATFTDLLASYDVSWGLGDIHTSLYDAPATGFRDVTVGDNGAYAAGPGYDEASGLGAPQWRALAPDLVGFVTLHVPAYSRSRHIGIAVTPAPGVTYTGWKSGVGAEPSRCDPTNASTTPPTTVTAPADGTQKVWVMAFASASCYVDTAASVVDSSAPTVAATAAQPRRTGDALSFHWTAADPSPSSGIAHYTVTITHHGSATPDYKAASTRTTSLALTGRPGRTYTLTVVATDRAGNVSGLRRASVTLPLDDRSLTYSGHWSRSSAAAAFSHTLTVTGTRGASARVTAVGHAYALLVTTCGRCGHLTEYVDGRRVRTISLRTATPRNLVSFAIASFARDGRHTITLVASGGSVELDALRVVS